MITLYKINSVEIYFSHFGNRRDWKLGTLLALTKRHTSKDKQAHKSAETPQMYLGSAEP